jgi:hypothetical protein
MFFDEAPEGLEYPYVIFSIISDLPDWFLNGKFEETLMQFSIYSISAGLTEITGILTNLRALYDDCSLSISGETLINFQRGNLMAMTDEITTTAGTETLKHWAQEYEIKRVIS